MANGHSSECISVWSLFFSMGKYLRTKISF